MLGMLYCNHEVCIGSMTNYDPKGKSTTTNLCWRSGLNSEVVAMHKSRCMRVLIYQII
jgi:hypothetical protein